MKGISGDTFQQHKNPDGIITFAKNSGCKAYRSSTDQTIPASTMTKLECQAEDYDIQSEYDPTTNYRFTAKKDGYYLIHACVYWSVPDPGLHYVYIRKNGAAISRVMFNQVAANVLETPITDILYLAANDYIEIFVYQTTGVAEAVGFGFDATWLNIAKLR